MVGKTFGIDGGRKRGLAGTLTRLAAFTVAALWMAASQAQAQKTCAELQTTPDDIPGNSVFTGQPANQPFVAYTVNYDLDPGDELEVTIEWIKKAGLESYSYPDGTVVTAFVRDDGSQTNLAPTVTLTPVPANPNQGSIATETFMYTTAIDGVRVVDVGWFGDQATTGPRMGFNVTVTCAPVPAAADALPPFGETIEYLTEYAMGVVMQHRSASVSNLINERLLGGGRGLQADVGPNVANLRATTLGVANSLLESEHDKVIAALEATGVTSEQIAAYDARSRYALGETLPWNAWVEANITGVDVDNALAFDGRIYDATAGVDYLVDNGVLIGLAGGYELYDFELTSFSGDYKGEGYTVGPYIGIAVLPNVVADLWAGYTAMNYEATIAGAKADFDADRWFASGAITGTFITGGWRFAPRIAAFYAQEFQESYTTSTGTAVASNTVEYGRVSFGPEIAYAFDVEELESSVEPYVWLRGEWDFAGVGTAPVGATTVSRTDLGASVGAGATVKAASGLSLRFGGAYESIGRPDEEVWSGEVRASYEW